MTEPGRGMTPIWPDDDAELEAELARDEASE